MAVKMILITLISFPQKWCSFSSGEAGSLVHQSSLTRFTRVYEIVLEFLFKQIENSSFQNKFIHHD